MTAEKRNWHLRFSLRELLIVMTLVAVAIWVTSWSLWDIDERLILGSWFVAVCLAIVWGRAKHRRGIGLAALAGGAAPLVAYAVHLAWVYWHLGSGNWTFAYWTTNLLATGLAGTAAGAFTAAAFTPPGLEDDPPHLRADRLLGRRVLLITAIVAAVLLVGGWTAWRRSRAWEVRSVECLANSDLVISRDGRMLAGYRSPAELTDADATIQVLDLTSRSHSPIQLMFEHRIESIALTPDGKQVAVALLDDQPQIHRLDSASSSPLPAIVVNTEPGVPEDAPILTFAANGRQLLMRTIVGQGDSLQSRIRTWNLADLTLEQKRDYQGACFVHWAGDELRLVRVSDAPTAGGFQGVRIGIVDWKTGQEDRAIGPLVDFYPLTFSADGSWLTVAKTLIDLRSGESRELPAVIHAFTPDCRHVIGVEQAQGPQYSYSAWANSSTYALPLIRHLWLDGVHTRMVVLDVQTGTRLRLSQWTRGPLIQQVQIPADASIAATNGWFNHAHLWSIPPVP